MASHFTAIVITAALMLAPTRTMGEAHNIAQIPARSPTDPRAKTTKEPSMIETLVGNTIRIASIVARATMRWRGGSVVRRGSGRSGTRGSSRAGWPNQDVPLGLDSGGEERTPTRLSLPIEVPA